VASFADQLFNSYFMRQIGLLFGAIVTTLIFSNCKNGNFKSDNLKTDSIQATVVKIDHKENKKDEVEARTADLLEGKWQHTEDKTNFLIFEKNHRKEIAEGMDKWDDEIFILSDHCLNESDSSNNDQREKGNYISCIESDLCWYISSLDSNNLTLIYMGRGNLLTYRHVKK
jgi:hypothetical protein